MIYLIIMLTILGMISFILIMPIKVRIIRNDSKNDIDIYLLWLLSKKIDIDDVVKYIVSSRKDKTKVSKKTPFKNIILFFKSHRIFGEIFKNAHIIKSTVVWNSSVPQHEFEVFSNIIAWSMISAFRNYLTTNFKSIKNEYYSVNKTDLEKVYEVDFEIIFVVRSVHIISAIIRNMKDISEIKKYKEEKSARTSNI